MASIPAKGCDVDFGQITRGIVARITTTPMFPVTAGIPVVSSANLTTLLNGTADAKGVLLPLFANLAFPKTEPIIEGENDNSTEYGVGHVQGGNVIRLEPMFTSINSAIMQALLALNLEALQIVFFNQFNQAILKPTGYGFPIFNQTITDVTSDGLNKKNRTPWGFTLPFGWSLEDGFSVVPVTGTNIRNLTQA